MNANATPRSIDEYLEQLRAALKGADPALIQDALYDAEEHLRSELAENPQMDEAALLAKISTSYGAPEEVADLYRDQEIRIQRALRPPPPKPRHSAFGRFFGVAADPRTYAAMFFMLLALPTGIFYFTWAVAGTAMSLGFAVLIFGVPFVVLFFGSVRMLSLLEGRIVEVMLGVRMPRRPPYTDREQPLLTRIGHMFTDPRSWSSLFYMLIRLPLGIIYSVILVTGLAISLAFIAEPFAQSIWDLPVAEVGNISYFMPPWLYPIVMAAGVIGLFVMMHVVRGLGRLHGAIAKHLLVKIAA